MILTVNQYYVAVRNSFSGDDNMGRELKAADIPIFVSGKYYAKSTNNQYRHYVNYATENYQDYQKTSRKPLALAMGMNA